MLPILTTLPQSLEEGVTYEPAGSNTEEELGYLCYPVQEGEKVLFTSLQHTLSITVDALIFAIIISCYLITWWYYRRGKKKIQEAQDPQGPNHMYHEIFGQHFKKLKKELIRAIGLISACFIVLRLPYHIFVTTLPSKDGVQFITPGMYICLVLYQMQFCVNIVIYAVVVADYREAFLDAFRFMCPCCCKAQRTTENEENEMYGN